MKIMLACSPFDVNWPRWSKIGLRRIEMYWELAELISFSQKCLVSQILHVKKQNVKNIFTREACFYLFFALLQLQFQTLYCLPGFKTLSTKIYQENCSSLPIYTNCISISQNIFPSHQNVFPYHKIYFYQTKIYFNRTKMYFHLTK